MFYLAITGNNYKITTNQEIQINKIIIFERHVPAFKEQFLYSFSFWIFLSAEIYSWESQHTSEDSFSMTSLIQYENPKEDGRLYMTLVAYY